MSTEELLLQTTEILARLSERVQGLETLQDPPEPIIPPADPTTTIDGQLYDFHPSRDSGITTAQGVSNSNLRVMCAPWFFSLEATFTTWEVYITATQASRWVSAAIYDWNGILLHQPIGVPITIGRQSITWSSQITLNPDRYIVAWTRAGGVHDITAFNRSDAADLYNTLYPGIIPFGYDSVAAIDNGSGDIDFPATLTLPLTAQITDVNAVIPFVTGIE